MTHPDAETLIQAYALNLRVVHMQTDGLSHEDSLIQPPFRGNCLNWVLGHILVSRCTALKLLDATPVWDEADVKRYRSGSEPITGAEGALSLERLLTDLDESQARLEAALDPMAPEALAVVIPFRGREQPLGQALSGLHWHETYHLGQLELLRQLAGTDDAII